MTIKLYHASSMPMWLEESIQLIFFYSRSPSIWRCDPLLRSSFDTRSRARCCCEPMRKTLCYLRSSQIYFLVPWIQNMFLYINLYPHLRMHLSYSIFIHISWRSFAPLTDSDPIHIHCFSKISKPEVPMRHIWRQDASPFSHQWPPQEDSKTSNDNLWWHERQLWREKLRVRPAETIAWGNWSDGRKRSDRNFVDIYIKHV